MNEKYVKMVQQFKELDIEDKKEEILKVLYDELRLLYLENKKIDDYNEPLGVFKKYDDDDSYFDLLFTYIMSLRDENDKLIDNLENLLHNNE